MKNRKTEKQKPLLILLFAGMACLSAKTQTTFTLTNKLNVARANETTEVSVPDGTDFSNLALYDANNAIVPYQVLADGRTIVFQATVPANQKAAYALKPGAPATAAALTYAAQKLPSSRNDIAWENDLSAFRMYSRVLLSSEPNTANGVDVWCKKKTAPIIDAMYNQSNYHAESEYGVDAYSVNGKTLGGGGIVAYAGGKLWLHDPYDACQIVENGPLRSEFILTYNNVTVDGNLYRKTVRITTQANGLLNKAVVKYEGAAKKMKLAAGIYLHAHTNGVKYDSESNLVGYAEDKSEGTVTSAGARIFTGIYMPGKTSVAEMDGHLVIMADYTVGDECTYYFGGAWNVFPEGKYATDEDWFAALSRFKQTASKPLVETTMEVVPQKAEVIEVIHKANTYWQTAHPAHGNAFWNRAAYHTGNMAAYEVTKDAAYLDFSYAWSEKNNWKGATSDNKSNWKYSYGEGAEYVLFGDWQICFQVYADLYAIEAEDRKIARAREVMEYQMSTSAIDYWWWVDGLYMVMPVMTRLYKITQHPLYLEKLYTYWQYANSILYDSEEGIYYRDAKYVYPAHKTDNGLKDFWSRGNGWVFAAFARVLEDLPETDPNRDAYIAYYQGMAKKLAELQMEEGYWSRSLMDPRYAAGYETSGTAFFTYGYLWGINNGYLSEKEYGKTVEKAWNYLTTVALQSNGKVGYVQPIGENAAQHNVSAETTADFGVGAFLLAASEMYKYAVGEEANTVLRLTSAKAVSASVVSAVFNNALDAQSARDIGNYKINGNAIEGVVAFDGARTVTITLAETLEYGRHTFSVEKLKNETGGVIEAGASKPIFLPVPLDAAQTGIVVSAIGSQSGNPHTNAMDGSLSTRWSQQGSGQWIKFDLGEAKNVYAVDLAFYLGDQRVSYFDIELSTDDAHYVKALSGGESSGSSTDLERYAFAQQSARYVRIVCNGTSAGDWNSVTETRIRYADESILDGLSLPSVVSSDFIMPDANVTWSSSNASVLTGTGLVNPLAETTQATLTAKSGALTKDFIVTVLGRNVMANNRKAHYTFDASDDYASGGATYLKDKSGNGNDARVYGSALIDGTLNLTANTEAGFATNGYLMLVDGLIDSLRSFSVLVKVNPSSLANLPRIYDFGSSASNSVFGRLDAPTAGFKYNGGTTALIHSNRAIATGTNACLAFTFDAASQTTKLYIDGELTAESTGIKNEPYQLSRIAPNKRNYIGRTQWWDSDMAAQNVDYCGTIDDFYLFDIALTKEEIKSVQEITSGMETRPRMPAYSLCPNPAGRGEEIWLTGYGDDSEYYDVRIVNPQGMLIDKRRLSSLPAPIGKINEAGLYLIKIRDASGNRQVKKIIIK